MFYAQRQMYPACAHLELPGVAPGQNAWAAGLRLIRQNTPLDSRFALNPRYMTLPGEDYHGFRALAERSALADYEKDAGIYRPRSSSRPALAEGEVMRKAAGKIFKPCRLPAFEADFGATWIILYAQDEPLRGNDLPVSKRSAASLPTILRKRHRKE